MMIPLHTWSGLRPLTIVALALLAAPICARSASAQETIKIGYINQLHDAALMSVEKELASKYKLEFIRFQRYTDAEVALVRGDIQVASLGYTNPIVASSREPNPSYKLVSGMSRGAINVVCNKDVKVATWNDLKGKKFGVLAGGPAELFFDDAISFHGVSRKDIPTVVFAAPGPPLLQALQNKDIECTAVYEPIAASAVAKGLAIYTSGINLAENSFRGTNGAVGVNAEFLKTHAAFATDVVAVLVKSTDYYNAHKDKLQTDFKRLEFTPDVIKTATDKVILDSKLYFASVMKEAQAMARLGFIKSVPDRDKLMGYYDYTYIAKATGKSADAAGRAE